MSVIGLLNSTFTQVHQMGRLHIRALQRHLSRHWQEGVSYEKQVPVPHSSKCSLRWWGCSYHLRQGTSLHDLKHDVTVFTDASNSGWGADCQGEEIQGDWTDLEIRLHINLLEMKAVLFALRVFGPMLKNRVVLFLCDNSTTVWHLRKAGGVRVWQMNALSWLPLPHTSNMASIKSKDVLSKPHMPSCCLKTLLKKHKNTTSVAPDWSHDTYFNLIIVRSRDLQNFFFIYKKISSLQASNLLLDWREELF